MKKPGYIYVLTHPSDPDLYKIGVTVLEPKKRLAQHNRELTKAAGLVVKETGQKWELKEYHLVPDPYFAERAFWATTPYSDIPYRGLLRTFMPRSMTNFKTAGWKLINRSNAIRM